MDVPRCDHTSTSLSFLSLVLVKTIGDAVPLYCGTFVPITLREDDSRKNSSNVIGLVVFVVLSPGPSKRTMHAISYCRKKGNGIGETSSQKDP
ncbi:hypothetical protein HZH66_004846 [Vespula vulgaris]|uniref:Uncharacterized protein n=1 Tax=Vespula vulgaris TaxID=7454 RepID=A0A834K8U4_VESVU|nr:hypothetical protein HZH66_004846 [Vespula vulgaris]